MKTGKSGVTFCLIKRWRLLSRCGLGFPAGHTKGGDSPRRRAEDFERQAAEWFLAVSLSFVAAFGSSVLVGLPSFWDRRSPSFAGTVLGFGRIGAGDPATCWQTEGLG
jgi:hypothetical protein